MCEGDWGNNNVGGGGDDDDCLCDWGVIIGVDSRFASWEKLSSLIGLNGVCRWWLLLLLGLSSLIIALPDSSSIEFTIVVGWGDEDRLDDDEVVDDEEDEELHSSRFIFSLSPGVLDSWPASEVDSIAEPI